MIFDDGRHEDEMHDGGRHLPADFVGLELALLVVGLVGVVAAVVLALIAVAAVALLSRLHQPVAADGLARFWKSDIAKFILLYNDHHDIYRLNTATTLLQWFYLPV